MSASDAFLNTLAEKIELQGQQIARLQAEVEIARKASVGQLLGQLRAREAILLYVGREAEAFAQDIAQVFGSDVANDVGNSLFVLDNAPIQTDVREAIRTAAKSGMNRW